MGRHIINHKTLIFPIVTVFLVGMLAACGSNNSPASNATPPSLTVTAASSFPSDNATTESQQPVAPPSQPTVLPSQIKNAVPDEIGEVTRSSSGSDPSRVIVFEERHDSRVGQIESAIILNRLYHRNGVRHLALEGAMVEYPTPKANWFHQLPDSSVRLEVALQLLKQGEVSAAEFMAMAFQDFELHPIESEGEYSVELSGDASGSFTMYLVSIAQESMSNSQINQVNNICSQEGRAKDCLDFIMGVDPWVKSRYEYVKGCEWSTEGLIERVDQAKERADQVGADVSKFERGLREERDFYVAASKRSETMIENVLPLVNKFDAGPISMVIGCAHTERVADLLSQNGTPYMVIGPNSLKSEATNGNLYSIAYERKVANDPQSVDTIGILGAYLDGRKKPSPVLNVQWFHTKAGIMYATTKIARAAAAGDDPPYGLDADTFNFDGGSVEQSTIKSQEGSVTFAVDLTHQSKRIWVKAEQIEPETALSTDEITLEEALRTILDEVKSEEPIDTTDKAKAKESEHSDESPARIKVSRDVVMQASTKPLV